MTMSLKCNVTCTFWHLLQRWGVKIKLWLNFWSSDVILLYSRYKGHYSESWTLFIRVGKKLVLKLRASCIPTNKEYFTVGRAWYIAVTVLHFVSQSSQARRRTLAVSWNKVGSNKWIMQNLFKKIYISLSEYLLVVRKQLNSKPHQHLFVCSGKLWKQ